VNIRSIQLDLVEVTTVGEVEVAGRLIAER
jgi:hypothetical protein